MNKEIDYVIIDEIDFDKAIEMSIIDSYDKESFEWQMEEYGEFVIEIYNYDETFWNKEYMDEWRLYYIEPYAELVTDKQIIDGVQNGKIESGVCSDIYISGSPEGEVAVLVAR